MAADLPAAYLAIMMGKGTEGQSLVELALVAPILLLLLIGIVDIGRLFYYTTALTNGVREGAVYASLNPRTATAASITQRVCDASGFVALGAPCPGLAVPAPTFGPGADTALTATYDITLLYGEILGRFGANATVRLRAIATFPVLAQ